MLFHGSDTLELMNKWTVRHQTYDGLHYDCIDDNHIWGWGSQMSSARIATDPLRGWSIAVSNLEPLPVFRCFQLCVLFFPTGKREDLQTAYKQHILTVTKTMNPWRLTSPRWAWGTTNSSFSWWCMAAFAPSLGVSRRSLYVASSCLKLRPFSEENDSKTCFLLVFWILRLAYIILYFLSGHHGDIRTFYRYSRINPRVVSRGNCW